MTPLCKERILSQGLLKSSDEKFEFLHLSYAEFFVADYILEQLSEVSPNLGIFFKILFDEKFENVRKFLNDGLTSENLDPSDSLKEYLTNEVNVTEPEDSNNRQLLHLTVSESQIVLLDFVLNCLDCDVENKIEILTNLFKKDGTIHRSINETGTEAFESLFRWLGNDLTRTDLNKVLASKGKDEDTILVRARKKNNEELTNMILEKSRT